jgi:hypothetical protein
MEATGGGGGERGIRRRVGKEGQRGKRWEERVLERRGRERGGGGEGKMDRREGERLEGEERGRRGNKWGEERERHKRGGVHSEP